MLLKGDLNWRGEVQPQVPVNVDKVLEDSALTSVLSFAIPLSNVVSSATGAENVDGRAIARQLRFGPADRAAQLQLLIGATALRRLSGQVDLSLKIRATFSPPYEEDEDWALRSLFQDQVSFALQPADPSLVNIDPRGVFPATDLKQVSYSNSVTWTVEGGFDSGGGSVKAGRSTQVSASSEEKDFDLKKHSVASTGRVEWVSRMRNLYSGSQPDSEGYDAHNPLSIVVRGPFTTSLDDPPQAAKSDLDLEFHAAYTGIPSDFSSRQVSFEFEARQRLMYARVAGRSGPSFARVGGKALVVPFYVIYRGRFTLDLAQRAFRLDDGATVGYNCTAQVPADPFQIA
jgi:hypothetical protein